MNTLETNPVSTANAHLLALLEALPDAVFFKDGNGRWLILNEAATALFCLRNVAWKGLTDLELAAMFPGMQEVLATCVRNDEAAWQHGSRFDAQEIVPGQTADTPRIFNTSRIPLYHADGSRRGLVVVAHEITEPLRIARINQRQRHSLARLNEIAAQIHRPLHEQFREALRVGAGHLGLDLAIISRIDGPFYEVVSQVSPPNTLQDGQRFPFGKTYCSITIEKGCVVAVRAMGESEYAAHPCYQEFQLEAYIGAPIRIDGQIYGTVNFSSARRFVREFDEADCEFVDLLARWIGAAIARDRIARQLEESELELRAIVEGAPECIKLMDAQGRIVRMNACGLQLLGASNPDQVIGQTIKQFVAPQFHPEMEQLNQRVFAGESDSLEFVVNTLSGEQRWMDTVAVPLRNAAGKITHHLGLTRDVSERRQHLEQIHHLAFYDTLTDLPNRRLLVDRLDRALEQAKRYRRSMALLFLDLDRFKEINDTLGHDTGDELLKEVANRLLGCVRAGDTVARQGGDEFIIILSEVSHYRDAAVVSEKILAALTDAITVGEQQLQITTSIGIAVYPVDGDDDTRELLKKSDMAMYAAKEAGRNTYHFFGTQDNYLQLEDGLDAAMPSQLAGLR